ncbi:DUF6250 domain-containing protein [Synoicihabitans lomoniglobus]|uniref:DUF6250 domain-containing protein n=1 Tax=Synoicihabitans lomoniglobus TaxID=2909285 RepID=A0AAF0CPE0_9BACT|nr:DUF6250 domain-containing protein [Opitutaceae bacterium LMO-M01]WED64249.1 DUF6250 domain-containing protein [Opitutaceae bacterium LMO-M01]
MHRPFASTAFPVRLFSQRAALTTTALVCLLLAAACSAPNVRNTNKRDTRRADFGGAGLSEWVVEQQPGGSVTIDDDALLITDVAGCTVWWREPLIAPVRIRYEVTVSSTGRVSDLNCFWMATDPDHPTDLFAAGHGRTGQFSTYDQLRLYYVGYGGNTNSTTRFRRYDGTGARPLDTQHDLQTPEFLLVPDHTYTIELNVTADGRVSYTRDGEVIYEIKDPAPLLRGWFGFRTVNSTTRVTAFEVVESP